MTLWSVEFENVLLLHTDKRDFADLVKVKDFEMGRLFWIMQVIPVIFPLSNLKGKKVGQRDVPEGTLWQGSRDFGPRISGNWLPKWAGSGFSSRASKKEGSL